MAITYLGLGSNIGDRQTYIARALERIGERIGKVTTVASIRETEPVGGVVQPLFLNTACRVETILLPEEVLRLCKAIEEELGRTPTKHWGPREIDIDILLYDTVHCDTPLLTLPHRYLFTRDFALLPLTEVLAR